MLNNADGFAITRDMRLASVSSCEERRLKKAVAVLVEFRTVLVYRGIIFVYCIVFCTCKER